MTSRRLMIAAAVLLLSCALRPHLAVADGATLTCTPPTTNNDGSALTNLAGYRVAYGTTATALTRTLTVASPASCGATVDNLVAGTWYFAITSYRTDGAESLLSATVSKTIAATPTCPTQPADETRLQSCAAPTTGSWTQTHGWTSAPAPACWTANAWAPSSAPAGACATPPTVTAGPYSYELTGTTSNPSMSAIGLLDRGLMCGPATKTVGAVKFCQVQRAQTDLIGWPVDKTLANGIWARVQ